MADTNELIDVCTDLIRLVEGVGCKDWRDQNGQRFKDTNEWVRAYVAINNARKESREQAIHPADAALADDAIIELVTDYAQSKVRAESCQYHYESKEYDKEASETLEQIRAALRARAVPDDALDLLRKVAQSDVMSDRSGVMFVHLAIDRDVIDDINAMLAASKEAK